MEKISNSYNVLLVYWIIIVIIIVCLWFGEPNQDKVPNRSWNLPTKTATHTILEAWDFLAL